MATIVRITLGLKAENKRLIEEAARLLFSSVSDFTITAALDKARQVLMDHQQITVSHQAFEHLLTELQRPPKILSGLAEQLAENQGLK